MTHTQTNDEIRQHYAKVLGFARAQVVIAGINRQPSQRLYYQGLVAQAQRKLAELDAAIRSRIDHDANKRELLDRIRARQTTEVVQPCDAHAGATPAPAAAQAPAIDPRNPVTVGYGCGTNSTAMLIEMYNRGEPAPALIMFADTGNEGAHTYAYLPVMNAWLRKVGWPEVTVVRNASPIAGDKSLYDECHRKSVLPSLAYGQHSCSLKWKVGPQDKKAREIFKWNGRAKRWAHGPWLTKLIGYDAGPADARRVKNAVGKWPPGYQYRYPLIEWGLDRAGCERVIREAGLPLPGKSSCWFCPAMKKDELSCLSRHHPELVQKGIELEARFVARTVAEHGALKSTKGLGRNWSWTEHFGGSYAQATTVTATTDVDLDGCDSLPQF